MSDELIRINKFLAKAGVASRRGADALVADGRVSVNGKAVDSAGFKVNPATDKVAVDGKPVGGPADENITILLHKPTQVVTTVNDPQGRKTVMDLLPEKIRKARPFPVGRLDFFSEGLLIMTTDGDLCHRLTHPRYHLPKVYNVTIRGKVSDFAIRTMEKGMTLSEGEELAPVKIKARNPVAGTQVIEMTLMQGVNRQIRRMFRDLDLTILRLHRVAQGPLRLERTLKAGNWRELTKDELSKLKKAVGL